MPYYHSLRRKIREGKERARVIKNLQNLKTQLAADLPDKDADENLLLASWNIRDFDAPGNRRGFGKRSKESLFYIAEILSRFDFVAVQEVNELDEWEEVMDILGPDWDYIATDVTDPKLGGNGERLTFLFDKRKMWFKNISGEIVLPNKMLISRALIETEEGKKLYSGKQFRRTPFVTSFQAGWFKFDVCTVHLYYGAESGEKLDERVQEIATIAKYFGQRAEKAMKAGKALILLGDFNIVHPEHKTMDALLDNGFIVPKSLRDPTNFVGTKYYDQIAFMTKPEVLDYIDTPAEDPKDRNSGVLNIYKRLYRPNQIDDYRSQMLKSPNGKRNRNNLKKYYKSWLTYQLSDHRPLWVRIKTNNAQDYLRKMRNEAIGSTNPRS